MSYLIIWYSHCVVFFICIFFWRRGCEFISNVGQCTVYWKWFLWKKKLFVKNCSQLGIFFTHGSTVNFSWPIGTNITFKSYDVRTLRHFSSTLKNIIKIEKVNFNRYMISTTYTSLKSGYLKNRWNIRFQALWKLSSTEKLMLPIWSSMWF